MKRFLLPLWALVASTTIALAQVNVVPSVGLTTGYLARQTYSSSFVGLVPVTAGTDVICIAGSATKTVRLQYIRLFGTTASAVQTLPIMLLKRASADTGGTPALTTANPGVTTQISKRDSNNGAATATLISYTANPTIVDTSPVFLDSGMMTMPIVTSAVAPVATEFNYARDTENFLQLPTLYGVAQQICVNINAATVTNASLWNGVITWTEE
jgi:hypothetical protein